MMRVWYPFHRDTGLFTGQAIMHTDQPGIEEFVRLSLAPSLDALETHSSFEWQVHRMANGRPEPYIPPAPDSDHEWNAEALQWQLREEVVERQQAVIAAQRRIDDIERKTQRPMLELFENPDDEVAAKKLRELLAERASLTPIVRKAN